MKILAFAEQREGKFKKAAFEVTQAARKAADQLGAETVTLVIGHGVEQIVQVLGGYGASRVLVADDPRLHDYSSGAYARIVAEAAQQEGAEVVMLPASQMGRDLTPRIAAKLEAGPAHEGAGADDLIGTGGPE